MGPQRSVRAFQSLLPIAVAQDASRRVAARLQPVPNEIFICRKTLCYRVAVDGFQVHGRDRVNLNDA